MGRRKGPLRVFCLEGEWEPDDPADRQSVRPLLELLEDQGRVESFYCDVATHEELAYYLRRWTEGSLKDFPFAYLAFHGLPGALCLNDDRSDPNSTVSLDVLGDLLEDDVMDGQSTSPLALCSTRPRDDRSVSQANPRPSRDGL